jgi:hypothetical protein
LFAIIDPLSEIALEPVPQSMVRAADYGNWMCCQTSFRKGAIIKRIAASANASNTRSRDIQASSGKHIAVGIMVIDDNS